MASILYDIPANTLKPSYNFSATVGEDGKMTGSHVFTCKFTDYNSAAVKALLQPGKPITDLDSNLPAMFNTLKIKTHTKEHQKGGITRIRVQLSGYSDQAGGGGGGSGSSKTYTYRGVLTKASILEHPKYLEEVTDEKERQAIAGIYYGNAYAINDGKLYIREKLTDADIVEGGFGHITPGEKWAKKVLSGVRDWDRPSLEWSIHESNEGGMTDAELSSFGQKVDEPEGSPPKPEWVNDGWWKFSTINESKSNDSSSFSRTYSLEFSKYDPDIHTF